MITFESSGSFKNMEGFLQRALLSDRKVMGVLHEIGKEGVAALSAATPMETGLAKSSWGYEVEHKGSGYTVYWTNSDIENGFPVVIMIQYGHGTGTGGYVKGQDFINPALKPVFDNLSRKMWKAVISG